MYHRFDEEKYPSTNIQLEIFKEQLKIIDEQGIKFIHPKNFKQSLSNNKKERKILLTIDDGLQSFYNNAWPILKKNEIPFILFVNTREVGSFNYMDWNQIKEIHQSEFAEIGNHSHSHEYLVNESPEVIRKDIVKSINIFKNKLGTNSKFFLILLENTVWNLKKLLKILNSNLLLDSILVSSMKLKIFGNYPDSQSTKNTDN